jgi:hypothetical protein
MIYMLSLRGSVRRVIRVCESIRVCGYFGHCYISQNLYNKMCEVGYVTVMSLHLFFKLFMQTTTKVAFPVLFGIACAKDASVAANLEFLGGSIQWNVSFVRAAHDWEVDVFASFFRCCIQSL